MKPDYTTYTAVWHILFLLERLGVDVNSRIIVSDDLYAVWRKCQAVGEV